MSIDAMKQVLEVMDTVAPSVEASAPRYYAAREALRAAIEQAEKPWVKTYAGGQPNYTTPEEPGVKLDASARLVVQPHPAFKAWQGLTDEEIKEIIGPWGETPIKGYTRKLFDLIEVKLKEKNHG
jgi:hypothetical protein